MRYQWPLLSIVLIAAYLVATADINGGWSPWSNFGTKCNRSCGGGMMRRFRSCSNPTPEGNGLVCSGPEEEWVDCNTHDCQVTWSEWSNCSAECARGKRKRTSQCGESEDECKDNQKKEETEDCNTWNKTTCPSPCIGYTCPQYAKCKDLSNATDPKATCVCTMGYKLKEDESACIRPPPTTPIPRPIPTLPPEQKMVAVVVTKTASTVLLVFVGLTLILFLVFRVFTPDRVIQMNMEIALVCAHIILLFPPDIADNPELCRVVAILLHLFFTAVFMFMFLEALYMYSLVAHVVKKDGLFSRFQNIIIGWGVSTFIVLFTMCFQYEAYGSGGYICWMMMNTPLAYAEFIPVVILVVLTFTLIEAAGSADYKPLSGIDEQQVTTAKIMQRTNLIIMPLVFASWIVGMLSDYEQNLPLYGTFSILNSVLGIAIFFFHTTSNEKIRSKLSHCYNSVIKKQKNG